MNNDKKIALFTICIFMMIIPYMISHVFGIASITLSPTSGNVGSTVSISGLGFTATNPTTSASKSDTSSGSTSTAGSIYLRNFSGLPAGDVITKIGLSVGATGITQNSILTGDKSSGNTTAFGDIFLGRFTGLPAGGNLKQIQLFIGNLGKTQSNFTRSDKSSGNTTAFGNIYAAYFTGLPPHGTIDKIQLFVGAVIGNTGIRVKTYDDNGTADPSGGNDNEPLNLLGEVNGINGKGQAVLNTGYQNFTANGTIPQDGNVFAAFELNSSSTTLGYHSANSNCGSVGIGEYRLVHTFGPGPSTMSGTVTCASATLPAYYVKIYYTPPAPLVTTKIYDDKGIVDPNGGENEPLNLLGEQVQIPVTQKGSENFSAVNVKIPSDGVVWAGFETNDLSTLFGYKASTGNCGIGINDFVVPHIFAGGPDVVSSGQCSGVSPQKDFYIKLYYSSPAGFLRVKTYDDKGIVDPSGGGDNEPLNLLGEGISIPVTTTGSQNYSVIAKIPSDGAVWAGFETSNALTTLGYHSANSNCGPVGIGDFSVAHTFGTGPNPFSGGSCSATLSQFFITIYYGAGTSVTAKLDGSTITTNPSFLITNGTGGFNTTITVPGTIAVNPHIVKMTDTSSNTASANFNIPIVDPTFSMWLYDMSAQILTGSIIQSYTGGTSTTQTLNGTGYTSFSANAGQNYNYTMIDGTNTFTVYKLLNNSTTTGFNDKQPTWETPINCVGSQTGRLSDFIIQVNDTDGTHITNLSAKCNGENQLLFNTTFTANGQSSNNYNSVFRLPVANSLYYSNPSSVTINSVMTSTSFTQGNNILSNSYSVGSGLVNHLLQYIINLNIGATNGGAAGGSGQLYVTTNSSCFAGVFNPQTNSCQFGLVGFNATVTPVIVNPGQSSTGKLDLSCSGTTFMTINNVNLGSNPLGFQIYGLPTTINCGSNGSSTPTVCQQGTTLQNGQCVGNPVCPISSQLSNGVCAGALSCPVGTTLQNGQCISSATCADGSMPIGNTCPTSGNITIQLPPQNMTSTCSITNPGACISNPANSCSLANLSACVTGTTQTEPATITGIASNGQQISAKTVLTAITNPELNNVSLVIIFIILGSVVGGVIYRYYVKTEKPSTKNTRSKGKDKNIKKFNENIRKK